MHSFLFIYCSFPNVHNRKFGLYKSLEIKAWSYPTKSYNKALFFKMSNFMAQSYGRRPLPFLNAVVDSRSVACRQHSWNPPPSPPLPFIKEGVGPPKN